VTPVLAMLHHLVAQRSDRDVWWLHAARRPYSPAPLDGAATGNVLVCCARPHTDLVVDM
jgi:ferredoxin-NADP reductase